MLRRYSHSITDASGKKVISWTSGDKYSVKVYVTEKDGYQNFKYSFDEKGNLLVGASCIIKNVDVEN